MTEHLLGIDIGTYESKGLLTTAEGRVVASAARPHELSIPESGRAEHDADAIWWSELCEICRELLERSGVDPGSILALGCSTIGPCCLPVDREGTPLRRAILYGIDTRATREIAFLNEELGERAIFERCGNDLSAQAVGPKILWIRRQEPEVFRKTNKFVSGTSYLVWKLTGRWVVDHYSASTFVPLYDRDASGWSPELCEGIVRPDQLPDILWTTRVAGRIGRRAARETGLPEGLPVIAGTTDASAEAVSAGVVEPGRLMIMYGSTAFLILMVPQPLSDRRIWSAPYLFPGTSAVMGGMATTGSLTRWFRDEFARELVEEQEAGGTNAYERLAAEAERVEAGSQGLLVLPYFSGERTPLNDPSARGAFFGLTLAHRRGHLYRAVLESTGFGIRHHLDVFRELEAPIHSLHAVGGGTRNPLWLQVVSDICQKQQLVPEVSIGASYGDALLAGLGVGAFSSPQELFEKMRIAREVNPQSSHKRVYQERYEKFRRLYEATRPLLD